MWLFCIWTSSNFFRMPPKRDIGWEHANPVGGDKKTVQCHYCGKVIRGGITRLKHHIAQISGHVEACPRAHPDVIWTLRKHLNDGKSKRATVKKRKAALVDAFHNNSLYGCVTPIDDEDDESDSGEDELSELERMQLKLAMEESRCMALIEEKCSENRVSRARPITIDCNRSLYHDANVINCNDDGGDIDGEGLSDLEDKQLKWAMQESRYMAFLEEEQQRDSFFRACRTAASWSGILGHTSASSLMGAFSGPSVSYSGKDGTEQPGAGGNSYVLPSVKKSIKKQGNARLKEDLVRIQKELKHQTKKDRAEIPPELEHKTLFVEMEHLRAQIDELNEKLADKDDELQDMEALNQTLILKERLSNLELQDARKELTSVLPKLLDRTTIGVKRMGEIQQKPFEKACLKKYFCSDWEVRSVELISLWQEKVNDPNWHPFKKILKDGKWQEIIDEDDSELKELRHQWGNTAYHAVVNALLELNEYNPSGRYVVQELWNFKAGRKASLQEVIHCMTQELRKLKSHNRRN